MINQTINLDSKLESQKTKTERISKIKLNRELLEITDNKVYPNQDYVVARPILNPKGQESLDKSINLGFFPANVDLKIIQNQLFTGKQPDFNKYFISDFVEIQRNSFFTLLEKGIIEEFSKRNPITNSKKTMEIFFYPDYYQLTPPEYSPSQAIIKSKS
jgi:hypothetical protein